MVTLNQLEELGINMSSINSNLKKHYILLHSFVFFSFILLLVFSVYLSTQTIVSVDNTTEITTIETSKKYPLFSKYIYLFAFIYACTVFLITLILERRFVNGLAKEFQTFYNKVEDNDHELLSTNSYYSEFNDIAKKFNSKIENIDKLNASKDEYFNTTLHDLRMPLQMLKSNFEIYKQIPDDEYLDCIENEINAVEFEVNRYLMLEKIDYFEQPNIVKCSLNKEIKEFIQSHNIDDFIVSLEVVDENVEANLDKIMFSKILSNLIQNGLKHSIDGHMQILILTDCILFTNKVSENVSTTNLFERKRTKSVKGYGLGTAIVAKYIEKMDWQITSSCANNIFQVKVNYLSN